jgi:hypothetical protein
VVEDKFCCAEGLSYAKNEYPEKHSWWLNELESLGVNELTTDIKQMFYEEYKKAFSDG